MRLRRIGTRGLRGRGTRSKTYNTVPIAHSFSLQNQDNYYINAMKMVKGEMVDEASALALSDDIKEEIIEEPKIPLVKEERLNNLSLKSNNVLDKKNLKLSKKDQISITNYFSPRISNTISSAAFENSDNHSNGICTIDELSKQSKSKSTKILAKHKAPLSSPTKENKKLANGYINSEHMISNVCTRSQSQKLLSAKPNCDWISPVKNAKESLEMNAGFKEVKRTLDLSPVKIENSSSPKDTEMSPHTGPPTPHKIQALNEEKLRLDTPLSASNALSKLKILSPGKLNFTQKIPKNKRKLPNHHISNNSSACTGIIIPSGPKMSDKKSVPINGALSSKSTMRNTQMTEFFPIRRSHRKPKTAIIQEKQKLIEEQILNGTEDGLRVECFGAKGRGIVSTRHYSKGEMIVEYVGDLIDMKEAKVREKNYALDTSKGCYMYYFNFQNTQYCIDATEESGYLGRLVNHSRNGNLATKTVEVNGKPHLVLVAKKDIAQGTEILYDYGDRSKQALEHHPWLAL